MALRDDEGRGKLRKAAGRCKRPVIRRCPNGATYVIEDNIPERVTTRGTETSKYPEEEKTISDSASSGERTRISPNFNDSSLEGCRTCIKAEDLSGSSLENYTKEGESPVHVRTTAGRVS